jgi:RNA polymerase sigma-70 factor (ECF subfamily)
MTNGPPPPAPSPGDTDQMLVQRTVAGDQKAYELLVIKYQRRIERLIGRMVRDVDLVEDIAQETFIRAYRALPSSAARRSSTPGCTGSPSTPPRKPWST